MNVLLTHSEGRLEGLGTALREHGFQVTHHPLVEAVFLPSSEARAKAETLRGADWLLFSSRTAVQAWAALALPLNCFHVGVVGQKTAEEVEKVGGRVSLTAEPANAEGLLRTFLACVSPPCRVGLPCGEQALPTLATGLGAAGFAVTKAVLYHTVTRSFARLATDLIVVASPSAVAALPRELAQVQVVALGPSSAQAARERGLHVTEAQTPDVRGVVRAVLAAAPLGV